MKNVISLAVGLATGMGLGANATSLLIARGLAARLGDRLGADPLTFSGLSGGGDLHATCASPLSRTRTFGEHLGQGMTVAQASAAPWQTAEGVKSCQAILGLAQRHGVEMPITEVVATVIDGRRTGSRRPSGPNRRRPC